MTEPHVPADATIRTQSIHFLPEDPPVNPPADPPAPVAQSSLPDPARRLRIVDLLTLLVMSGLGLGAARYLESAIVQLWNFSPTAPWPAYSTPAERYALGSIMGFVAAGPVILSLQKMRGRWQRTTLGEFAWLVSAAGLLGLLTLTGFRSYGPMELFLVCYFLFQAAWAIAVSRSLVLALLEGQWNRPWTEPVGCLVCVAFAGELYFGCFGVY